MFAQENGDVKIEKGYSACVGMLNAGWYGGVLVLDGRDESFFPIPAGTTYEQRAAHAQRWIARSANPSREIMLVIPEGDDILSVCIAAAERIEGPVAPREKVETPTLVWIERRDGQWHLVLFAEGEIRTIMSRKQLMRCPRVAVTGGGLFFAIEVDCGPHSTAVALIDACGTIVYRTEGREPLLCTTDDGVVLSYENYSPNHVKLSLAYFSDPGTGIPASQFELAKDDYLINADMAWVGNSLYLAAECSPRWGYSSQIGLHREIIAWKWSLAGEAVSLGALPIESRAFRSLGVENIPPIKPYVLSEGKTPVIVFKQHRFTGVRAFEWDLFMCKFGEGAWGEPVRLSRKATLSDSTFGLVFQDDAYVGLLPTHENAGGNGSKQSEHHQVEVVRIPSDPRIDRVEIAEDRKATYRMPPSCYDVAGKPPALASPYTGRQLIWGDLHIHSIYSKCVGAVDGSPRENIRFARDVLGCRVFAITEHTQYTTGIESTWLFDQLESTAGTENVVLYATEPGIVGTRHMNFYCKDRLTFEKLERILLAQEKCYPDVLRQIREDLPPDSVFVMRHVHGDAIPDAQILQHFDPCFEPAMEAMQGRGNAMLEACERSAKFPNAFLDAGCKIGLVGGTDHFREWAPNHFCLTGFWVKDISPEGVWEAIRNRFTLAMSDSRVAMATRCKGVPMGGVVSLRAEEPLVVHVSASCAHSIRRITLLRDGELLPWMDVGAKTAEVKLMDETVKPGRHWYVVTVEVDTGHGSGNTGICHASPYFVWKADE